MCTLPAIIITVTALTINGIAQPPHTLAIQQHCRVNPFQLHIIIHNLHVYGRWRKERLVHVVTAKDCHKNAKLKECKNG